MSTLQQDKQTEIAFFDRHGAADDYDVFAPGSSARLISEFVRLTALPPQSRVIDLGCGSGTFTSLLQQAATTAWGSTSAASSIEVGRRKHPGIELLQGDIEHLPFADASFDGVLLSGVVHHFPDPSRCAAEVSRILRPQGRFVAFDPNRMNPFMWLYRDPRFAVLQLRRSHRERAAGAARAKSPPSSSGQASRCPRTISPVWPIATWHLRARAAPAADLQYDRRGGVRAFHHETFPSVRAHCRRQAMTAELDIVIPVYNEGRNIVATLAALHASVRRPRAC